MSENGSIEDNRVGNLSENTKGEVPQIRVLTQEAFNKQIKGFNKTARESDSAASRDDDNATFEPLAKGRLQSHY